jgi:hypothetical protein
MKKSELLISALNLLIVLFLLAMGVFFLLIYFSPNFLIAFVNLLTNKPKIILEVALLIISFAILSFVAFYFINKVQYIKFSLQNSRCLININLIQSYLEKYFNFVYPNQKNDLKVCIDEKNKLDIILNVDSLDNKQEYLLNLEDTIGKILSDQLNYHKEFTLTLKTKK